MQFQRMAKRDKKAFLSEQCRDRRKQQNGKDQRSQENWRYQENIHTKIGTIEDRNSKDLAEAEDIKKMWQEYTEELYKKDLNDPDNYDDVVIQELDKSSRHPGV